MFYRFQQFVILVVHLALLSWILYILQEAGQMSTTLVLMHFTGMALLGGFLIFGTAQWAKYHHNKNISQLN